jgi:hypothetical protein
MTYLVRLGGGVNIHGDQLLGLLHLAGNRGLQEVDHLDNSVSISHLKLRR